MKQRILWIVVLMVASTAFAGTPPLDPVLTTYENGFSGAVQAKPAGDGSGRLFVVEQGGDIEIIDDMGNGLATPFLDITTLVSGGSEQGLLGVAFHPDYSNNGFFYVNYTDNSGDTVIARYTVSAGDANIANPASALTILTIDQDFSNHNAGDLEFGPDGYLYIPMGDGGDGNDPCNRGQTIDPNNLSAGGACAPDASFGGNDDSRALLGALLRIDVDNPGMNVGDACAEGVNYGIPADNPFSDANPDCGEIFAYGLRNPFRFSFDRQTGDIFMGDVGQGAREEVDFMAAGSSGQNFGWRCREGFIPTPGINCTAPGAVDPIIDYPRSGGRCSVIGGYRYRGPEFTWTGTYIYADFCAGELYYSVFDGANWSTFDLLADAFTNIRGFAEDEQGNMYFVSSSAVVQINDGNFDAEFIFVDGFEN